MGRQRQKLLTGEPQWAASKDNKHHCRTVSRGGDDLSETFPDQSL